MMKMEFYYNLTYGRKREKSLQRKQTLDIILMHLGIIGFLLSILLLIIGLVQLFASHFEKFSLIIWAASMVYIFVPLMLITDWYYPLRKLNDSDKIFVLAFYAKKQIEQFKCMEKISYFAFIKIRFILIKLLVGLYNLQNKLDDLFAFSDELYNRRELLRRIDNAISGKLSLLLQTENLSYLEKLLDCLIELYSYRISSMSMKDNEQIRELLKEKDNYYTQLDDVLENITTISNLKKDEKKSNKVVLINYKKIISSKVSKIVVACLGILLVVVLNIYSPHLNSIFKEVLEIAGVIISILSVISAKSKV